DLGEDDKALLRQYAHKVKHNITDEAWRDSVSVYTKETIPTIDEARARIAELSQFKPRLYDCCINSCIAYVGKYADKTVCPNRSCRERRRTLDGRPRKQFCYLPLIPRLKASAQSRSAASEHQYRAQRAQDSNKISDVFDSLHFRSLRTRHVVVDGEVLPHYFFSDDRDVPIGVSTDGFAPFRRRSSTC
ncbi:hypothetical protein PENSPDRAFT_550904, partial [Peniophora sp. CONT]